MNSHTLLTLPVGQLQSNCYIFQINKNEVVIIDPGDDDQYIIGKLLENDFTPVAILATHGHFDHILAGFSLQAAFNIPFYIDTEDNFLLDRMRVTAIHFGEVDPGPAPIVDHKLKIENFGLEVLHTHGHTPGSVSYYDPKNKIIFVGDLLFADGSIGELTHKYSNRDDAKKSIKKILKLPKDVMVYPGHGESTSIYELREKFGWALV